MILLLKCGIPHIRPSLVGESARNSLRTSLLTTRSPNMLQGTDISCGLSLQNQMPEQYDHDTREQFPGPGPLTQSPWILRRYEIPWRMWKTEAKGGPHDMSQSVSPSTREVPSSSLPRDQAKSGLIMRICASMCWRFWDLGVRDSFLYFF